VSAWSLTLLLLLLLLQVGALLNQLQELLRRAEVERDRAKLQLKRQRVSRAAAAEAASTTMMPYLVLPLPYQDAYKLI
jgi:hypothetical protein